MIPGGGSVETLLEEVHNWLTLAVSYLYFIFHFWQMSIWCFSFCFAGQAAVNQISGLEVKKNCNFSVHYYYQTIQQSSVFQREVENVFKVRCYKLLGSRTDQHRCKKQDADVTCFFRAPNTTRVSCDWLCCTRCTCFTYQSQSNSLPGTGSWSWQL